MMVGRGVGVGVGTGVAVGLGVAVGTGDGVGVGEGVGSEALPLLPQPCKMPSALVTESASAVRKPPRVKGRGAIGVSILTFYR